MFACGCTSLKFSMNGRFLASGFCDGSIRIHGVKKGSLRFFVHFHYNSISSIIWTLIQGKRMLVACSKDEKASLWNIYKD
ncbi:unnamed protein product [Dracunculus medinensis]|uniref:WD_REPEATS_REGION domain-containing protein n=1 Tax=Dracunculus medinensis TaxID=318479 RepID=A0A0N4UD75_DRAME|nr:unnamed protein product [Dracunculus medinensis]